MNDTQPNNDAMQEMSSRDLDAEVASLEVNKATAGIIAHLQDERDEAVAARQRALADFANFQRRSRENESRERINGVVSVLRSLIPALDHFELAVNQEAEGLTVGQLLAGVRMVRTELLKTLESHGVTRIEPRQGEEFDPRRHEAVLHQAARGIAPHHIVAVLQPGFAVNDMVLRPAKVSVAPEQSDR